MVENNSANGDSTSTPMSHDISADASAQRLSHQSTTTGSEVGLANSADSSSQNATTERQLLTFEEDLWDQLDRITAYHKHGSSMVLGLQNFAIGYNKLVKNFAEGLNKYTNDFEKDMFHVMRSSDYVGKRGEASELEFSTLSIAITGVRSGIDVLSRMMEDSAQDIVGDMIEPLETYHKHYSEDSQDSISKSHQIWSSYKNSLTMQ